MDYFKENKASHWLFAVRQNGTSMIDLTDIRQYFQEPQVLLGLLLNVIAVHMVHPFVEPCGIVQVCIFGMGHLQRRSLLIRKTSYFIILLNPAYEGLELQKLKIRFK